MFRNLSKSIISISSCEVCCWNRRVKGKRSPRWFHDGLLPRFVLLQSYINKNLWKRSCNQLLILVMTLNVLWWYHVPTTPLACFTNVNSFIYGKISKTSKACKMCICLVKHSIIFKRWYNKSLYFKKAFLGTIISFRFNGF